MPFGLTDVVARHRESGRDFVAAGVRSFVLDRGSGEAVICMHGVPTSAFLYRKVVAELADRGMRGVAFDLPGAGLAERPETFDYGWTNLGRFSVAAIDSLGIDRFHLVVHDIGGPVGLEVAAALPQRVQSITLLNTVVDADRFHRPWMMDPYARPGLGPLWLASTNKLTFRAMMYYCRHPESCSDDAGRDRCLRCVAEARRRREGLPEDDARVRTHSREGGLVRLRPA